MNVSKMDYDSVLKLLPDRKAESHKGDYGKILLICGSKGYTGAAALAAMGALRSGSGLVYLSVPESVYSILASKLWESIVIPLPDHDGHIAVNAINFISQILPNIDAVLIGPGLGRSSETEDVVRFVLTEFSGPVVLDADGINAMINHKDILRGRKYPTIITPHEGEFTRFGGLLQNGRLFGAVELAKQTGSIVVLKGHETVITDGTSCYINTTGNPGMAVGGSGDVLAGIIVSLIGQGLNPLDAAACGVWLHGASGDICADEIGQYGMLPTDMLEVLPRLMK